MIRDYDQEIEKQYHPENFRDDAATLDEAERMINYAISMGALSPEEAEDWTEEQKIAYYFRCLEEREN